MTSVLSASPVTSSAMIRSGFLLSTTFSRNGTSLATDSILSSCTRTSTLSSSTRIFSTSVTKFGLR